MALIQPPTVFHRKIILTELAQHDLQSLRGALELRSEGAIETVTVRAQQHPRAACL